MKFKQLIVGIDPGSTMGYAVFGIDRKLIAAGSEKNFPIKDLISRIISHGDTIIVGTDKKVAPYYVSQFSTKVGAKVILPRKDILVSEKRILAAGFKTNNAHEMDALASALFAFREISPILERINRFVDIYDRHDIKDEIIKKVFIEEMSIQDSAQVIDAERAVETAGREFISGQKFPETDKYSELRKKIRNYKNDILQITAFNKKLLGRIRNLEDKLSITEQKSLVYIENKVKSASYLKEQRINSLMRMIGERDKLITEMKKSIDMLNAVLLDVKNLIIVKRFPNLRFHTYEIYSKSLGIQKGDILYVEQPNEYHPDVIAKLKDFVEIIITKNQQNDSKLPFTFIDSKSLEMAESEFFCAISKSSFEKLMKDRNLLESVIENYKKSRMAEQLENYCPQ